MNGDLAGEIIRIDCPVCGESGLVQNQTTRDIPHLGEVLISTLICESCGYRHTDVMPTENREPSRYIYRYGDVDGLSVRVVRSGASTVRIPELGVYINPGMAGEGYITNVEGILERITGILKQMGKDLKSSIESGEGDPSDIDKRISNTLTLRKKIEGLREGEGGFTLIIEDPYGNSAIISEKDDVEIEALKPEEIASLLDERIGSHI